MRTFLLFAIACLCAVSCEKLFFRKSKASKNPQANFEYLWKQCSEKYSYFDVKGIDWDAVHDEYAAQIHDGMSEDELFSVLGAMMNELRDDHSNLISPFNVSIFKTDHLGQDNFDFRLIEDHYLPENYYISGPFIHDFIRGTDERIGYIRFGSFSGNISAENLDFALDRYSGTDGIILDLRENGGGAVLDVFELLGRFVPQRTLLYYSRIKNGPGRNDFSEAEAAYVEPKGTYYGKKVIVLIDRGTFSAGSFTALGIRAIPTMTLLGDTTGGGLGLPNGGQLPNGWNYRFSVSQALDLNGDPQFENGVPPHITTLMDWTTPDTDELIERAITEIE
jgi:hypothetical protein